MQYGLTADQMQLLDLIRSVSHEKVTQLIEGANRIRRNIISDMMLGRVRRKRLGATMAERNAIRTSLATAYMRAAITCAVS